MSRGGQRRGSQAEWHQIHLMHPEAAGIRIKKGYLGKGAERAAYEMSEITAAGEVVGQPLVAKVSIHHEPDQLEFHNARPRLAV